MSWSVIYHPDVAIDLRAIGQAEARIILGVITKRIKFGEPDKLGKALSGRLAGSLMPQAAAPSVARPHGPVPRLRQLPHGVTDTANSARAG